MVKSLSGLRKRIIIDLEDGGSQSFCSLTNMIGRPVGKRDEIENMTSAVRDLINEGLIYLSQTYDNKAEDWPPIATEKALAILQSISERIEWSSDECYWRRSGNFQPPEVCLTDAGYELALQILSDEGYPMEKLSSYSE